MSARSVGVGHGRVYCMPSAATPVLLTVARVDSSSGPGASFTVELHAEAAWESHVMVML